MEEELGVYIIDEEEEDANFECDERCLATAAAVVEALVNDPNIRIILSNNKI